MFTAELEDFLRFNGAYQCDITRVSRSGVFEPRDLLWASRFHPDLWARFSVPYPSDREWEEMVRQAPSAALRHGLKNIFLRVSPAAWEAAVLAAPDDAIEYGWWFLERLVPPEAWIAAAKAAPTLALAHADKLRSVVPPEVWVDIVRECDHNDISRAKRHLSDIIPPEIWAHLAAKYPFMF